MSERLLEAGGGRSSGGQVTFCPGSQPIQNGPSGREPKELVRPCNLLPASDLLLCPLLAKTKQESILVNLLGQKVVTNDK